MGSPRVIKSGTGCWDLLATRKDSASEPRITSGNVGPSQNDLITADTFSSAEKFQIDGHWCLPDKAQEQIYGHVEYEAEIWSLIPQLHQLFSKSFFQHGFR